MWLAIADLVFYVTTSSRRTKSWWAMMNTNSPMDYSDSLHVSRGLWMSHTVYKIELPIIFFFFSCFLFKESRRILI